MVPPTGLLRSALLKMFRVVDDVGTVEDEAEVAAFPSVAALMLELSQAKAYFPDTEDAGFAGDVAT